MKTVIEAFIECVDGNLAQPADSTRFFESLLGRDVDQVEMRRIFNNYHSLCSNFKEGEDDCPDCLSNQS
jgi:hypothetical protein